MRTAFNIAQMAVAVGLCGAVYQALEVNGPIDLVADAPALAIAAFVYLVVNDSLVAAVLSIRGRPFFQEWRMSFKDILLPYVSMAPLGALAAYTYQATPWSLLYFVPLVLVVYNGFKLFVSLQHETDAALVALADSIDRRDKYTYEHSVRVADYVAAAARALHLAPREIDLVVAAARVHDLGKMATDNRVLLKPAALTAEERRLIEKHATEGDEIAGKFSMFRRGRRFIRHHHERWDGTGYPDGLAGEQIPLGARLIAVADAFDAMTTDRPHRKALGHDVAVTELRNCAGTQFDPDVVQAFTESAGRSGCGRRRRKARRPSSPSGPGSRMTSSRSCPARETRRGCGQPPASRCPGCWMCPTATSIAWRRPGASSASPASARAGGTLRASARWRTSPRGRPAGRRSARAGPSSSRRPATRASARRSAPTCCAGTRRPGWSFR